jgi:hypothetical protein
MCRLCDQIGPICPWRAKRSLEAYFADWPCSDCEPDDDKTTPDASQTCLLGQAGQDELPAAEPPLRPYVHGARELSSDKNLVTKLRGLLHSA